MAIGVTVLTLAFASLLVGCGGGGGGGGGHTDPGTPAGSYTITVEDGDRRETLSVADAEEEKEPAAAALREWIEARLPRQPRQ